MGCTISNPNPFFIKGLGFFMISSKEPNAFGKNPLETILQRKLKPVYYRN